MNGIRTRRWPSGTLRWAALAAAVGVTACQGSEQAAVENAAAEPGAAPSPASAVHGEQPTTEAPHATVAETMEVGYACADNKTFTIAFAGSDEILITIDGEAHTLARTTGHTGMLFSNDDIVFYSQGREASVEIGGVPTLTDCQAQGHPE